MTEIRCPGHIYVGCRYVQGTQNPNSFFGDTYIDMTENLTVRTGERKLVCLRAEDNYL